jgi:parallel beta-helix repeat protein
MRKRMSILLCTLLVTTTFALVGPGAVGFEPGEGIESELGRAGFVEGEGYCFEVTNSTYLNVTLCSTEVVNVTLESVPRVVSLTIETVDGATSTDISLSGFVPGMAYYRHQDGYLIESFFADEGGGYSYAQDLSKPHHMFIAEETSTKYIRDNPTGGDCTSFGTWDWPTKTCTLSGDVYETIQINSSGITLDGNGYSIIHGSGSYGIYVSGSASPTIKNVKVSGFSYGIYLYYASKGTLSGNTVTFTSPNTYGIYLYNSNSSVMSGNTVTATGYPYNSYGIYLYYSNSSMMSGNTITASGSSYGIYLYYSDSSTMSGNTVTSNNYGIVLSYSGNSTMSGNAVTANSGEYGYGICLHYSGGGIVSGNAVTVTSMGEGANGYGIYLYYSSGSTVSGNAIKVTAMAVENTVGYGIYLYSSGSSTMSGNTVTVKTRTTYMHYTSGYSIYLYSSGSSTISGNTVTVTAITYDGFAVSYAIHLAYSGGGMVSGNTVTSNGYGIILSYSGGGTVSGNTVTGNNCGIFSSNNNRIFHNNFIDNAIQVIDTGGNTWDNGAGEGNYWSDYTGLDDGSNGRIAGDGIGDTNIPHPYPEGVDWYPLMEPWVPDPVDEIEDLKEFIDGLDLSEGLKNSLLSQLDAAANALANGQPDAAINILNAFINYVEALKKAGKLTEEDANYIISEAQDIIDLIEGE